MKRSKRNKYIIFSIAFIAFVLIAVPGLASTIFYTVTGIQPTCTEAPYNSNCVCEEGQRKIYVPWLGVPRWSCEDVEQLILDPDSPTFEQDAIEFAKNYLSTYCGDVCGDITCGDNSPCIQGLPEYPKEYCVWATYGYDSNGRRQVNIECNKITEWDENHRPLSGITPWRMQFLVESDAGEPFTYEVLMVNNYCYNERTNKKCTLPEVCQYYGNPEWCIGNLPIKVIQ